MFPRPRRFGKTLNLSMLRYFLERRDENLSHLCEGLHMWGAGESYRSLSGSLAGAWSSPAPVGGGPWVPPTPPVPCAGLQPGAAPGQSHLISSEDKGLEMRLPR
ncbi:MAG: hypothetical protein AMXMBFR64_62000 [Myxococcales bacterium]